MLPPTQQPRPFSLNAPGPFIVEDACCIACQAPEAEAPDLMTNTCRAGAGEEHGYHCFFKRQPQTEAELDQAIGAVLVSCCKAVQYIGDDPAILARLNLSYREHLGRVEQKPPSATGGTRAATQTRADFRFSILELMIGVAYIACFLACLFSNWAFVIIALVIHVVVFWPTWDWLECERSQRLDLDKLRKVCTMWAFGNWLMLGLAVVTRFPSLMFVFFTSVVCATAFGSAWLFQVAILWSRDCVRRLRRNKSQSAGSQDA